MARGKRKASINLNKIENFTYALTRAPEKIQSGLKEAMDSWSASVQGDYDSVTGYGSGFPNIKGSSFRKVEAAEKSKGLHVSVGHAAYIARFLEVGTKTHDISHKRGKSYWTVRVRGIKGSKALSNVWNKRKREIPQAVRDVVKRVIEGSD